ncbi:MAG: hypothetical protein A2831_03375 [Candidatus Yanofskybacteria bacterium RIFCSPHIGHO2_01_FULL_44_17]|uniref:Ada DNA repair metal-binding domain-containing protein n=1 Tax=Candidatus Yanofskybacteria bacterium RIFCSPHIGHO2_01_FULL_44_17 TaxID=1802668 RepID=A0A1F8EYY6_9BACT|nr:MAG: hypothetical protein A2831_03375 [Candidatus Yanofskybacteria bacterium RIFCSPHIGHO2_01_FULL_44_17]
MNLIKFLKTYQADVVLALAIILISVTAFNLGKISAIKQQKTPITITQPQTASTDNLSEGHSETQTQNSQVIASKNSTSKVYHFLWCASGSKISEKNKITFATEAAAISAGYTLAGNCQK